MHRRLLTILVPLALASLASGCTTFTDNDAAARVGDTELSEELLVELATFIPDVNTGLAADITDADHARNAVRVWVEGQAIGAALERLDIAIDQSTIDQVEFELGGIPGFQDLSDEARSVLVDYVAAINTLQIRVDGSEIIGTAIADADIHIDPRIGTIDPQVGVVPLG